MQKLPAPILGDNAGSFNGLAIKYDLMSIAAMEASPPHDVFLTAGAAHYTPLIAAPWAYDPSTGLVYYCNGNYDRAGNYFYDW
jgi:hypothetical protein